MKERPILFSRPMVRAILAGQKTQTRRVVKPQPVLEGMESFGESWAWRNGKDKFSGVTREQLTGEAGLLHATRCPYAVGMRLWVRETWAYKGPDSGSETYEWQALLKPENQEAENCWYRADQEHVVLWRPSIFMPRWASRLMLEVVSVRVERVQDITPDDACAEGIGRHIKHGAIWYDFYLIDPEYPGSTTMPVDSFASLWDSINAARGFGWAVNPWVWVVEFKRVIQKAAR